MIQPIRLTRRNPVGGLLVPVSSIGAALRKPPDHTRWGYELGVALVIVDGRLTIRPQ